MYIYMYMYMYIYVYVYVYIYICVYVYIYICIYVCIYILYVSVYHSIILYIIISYMLIICWRFFDVLSLLHKHHLSLKMDGLRFEQGHLPVVHLGSPLSTWMLQCLTNLSPPKWQNDTWMSGSFHWETFRSGGSGGGKPIYQISIRYLSDIYQIYSDIICHIHFTHISEFKSCTSDRVH